MHNYLLQSRDTDAGLYLCKIESKHLHRHGIIVYFCNVVRK